MKNPPPSKHLAVKISIGNFYILTKFKHQNDKTYTFGEKYELNLDNDKNNQIKI